MHRSTILRASSFVTLSLTGLIRADVVITTDTVQNGGVLTVDPIGALVIHGPGNPEFTMTNGATSEGVFAVLVGTEEAGDGRLRIDGGSTLVTQTQGSPTIGIYDGYQLEKGKNFIGYGEGSTGIATVHGAGTSWNAPIYTILGVWPQSYGELNVEAGAFANIFAVQTAQSDTASAAINVTGEGSKLRISSGLIGNSAGGFTNILIDEGGFIESGTGGVELARSAGSTVSLVIRGVGSRWHEFGRMAIGVDGQAVVRIEDGGLLWSRGAAQNIDIGKTTSPDDVGIGTVTVTGAGSTLRSNSSINVGRGSTLIAEEGGRIVGNGRVGFSIPGEGGSAIIRGPGSHWEGNVSIDSGGTLLVEQGGEINGDGDASAHIAIVKDTSSAWNVAEDFKVNATTQTPGEVLIQNNATLAVGSSTTIESGAALTIDNAYFTNHLGTAAEPITGEGRLNIRNGSIVSFDSARIHTLEVTGEESRAGISASGDNGTSKFNTLIITNGGRFSISDDGVIISGMIEADITQLVVNGYNNGAWNGENGINSTRADDPGYAIGVVTNNTTGTWRGQPVAPGDHLISATLQGDTDLSFTVDFADLLMIAHNYDMTSEATWDMGDSNYDGFVDFNDLLAVAQNYGSSALSDGSITIDQSLHSRFDSDWQSALMSIPEPSSLMLLSASALILRRRNK